ncbi:LacI family DNA-binding transcriptional regulator [Clostridium sp. NSJ-49]|uniref:substrate-binding domain-containing protein n=1 Tax=Clostridium TaxID=1485 RepID=UPI00164B3C38|nr:LacI family DNA-binding transcriptional regulator [Clostridium sp. NSJ-49]MBC5625569.1 LacI family DNA-binding transcriptional regulator [Clostridium sp. NSJ-49]MDU6339949.1 LacI family DNA-binding transcriptional regulator [Clostridium sp.]
MVKQEDIARILNVSRTTVARALNGKGNIKPETKKRILDLCEELGYVKNPISTSLALKNEKNIYAFIIKGRNNYYTETIKRGLRAAYKDMSMYKLNLFIVETHIDFPEEQVERVKKVIRQKQVDGIIITPLLKEKIKKIKIDNPDISFIALDLPLDRGTISIYSNYNKLGRILGNLLLNSLEKGDKVLLIETDDDMISAKDSFEGVYQKLLEERKNDIIGPIFISDLENNIPEVINKYLTKDIRAVYASRFLESMIEYIFEKEEYELKIVTIGLSDKIKKFIKEDKVKASITPDYFEMSHTAINMMFECIYRGVKPEKIKNENEFKIIVKENL